MTPEDYSLQPAGLKTSVPVTPSEKKNRRVLLYIVISLLVLLVLFGLWRWFKGSAKPKHDIQPPVVVFATAQSQDVPVFIDALGAVTPIDNVTVKTQINGQLLKVYFKEGQMVKMGNVLAEIDPRPFQAQLMQYQGQLIRDKALLADAILDLARFRILWKQDSISKQTLDTQEYLVKQYEGAVISDQGLINSVKLNVIYSKITSPISGRIGLRLVDPGNFVQTTDTTGLFVINTIKPMTVVFTIAEDFLPKVIKQLKKGPKLIVEAYNRNQDMLLETGTLLAIDNQIDPTTGTVKIKAKFDNKNEMLFPNQFVNARLKVETLLKATTIPTAAIQHGTKDFVFVLNDTTKTVHIKPITVGIVSGENTVIKSGVNPGEKVITEGTDKLIEGSHVKLSQTKTHSTVSVTTPGQQ